jgi:hypothetical protein
MHLRIFIFIMLLFFTVAGFAQSRKKKQKAEQTQSDQPTTRDPGPMKDYSPKASRKKSSGPTFESEQKYYERMEELNKTRKKNEKLQEKPQYSDPMYFGHKRPPKKRKPGKMKYCKECGLRH